MNPCDATHSADFEVLHAGRTHPDGDPAALIREQLQRVLREAERQGLRAFVEPAWGGHAVSVVRVPGESIQVHFAAASKQLGGGAV